MSTIDSIYLGLKEKLRPMSTTTVYICRFEGKLQPMSTIDSLYPVPNYVQYRQFISRLMESSDLCLL